MKFFFFFFKEMRWVVVGTWFGEDGAKGGKGCPHRSPGGSRAVRGAAPALRTPTGGALRRRRGGARTPWRATGRRDGRGHAPS